MHLETGKATSIKNFATKQGIDHGDAKKLLPVSYLAPSIVEDILAGSQPADLTAQPCPEPVALGGTATGVPQSGPAAQLSGLSNACRVRGFAD